MEKLILNEMEAIQFTIEHGYEGEELESAKFKKLGCLDGQRDKETGEFKNRAMIKFIRKLQTIFENVEVEGKGKKRTYILSGKKDEISEIEDGRHTGKLNEDDEYIAKYFYNRLLDMKGNSKPYTYSKWAIAVGSLNPKLVDSEKVTELFKEEYFEEDLSFIYNSFSEYIKTRNQSIASNSIKLLSIWDKINVYDVHMAITLNKEYIEICAEEYDDFYNKFKSIVNKYNLKIDNYKYYINYESYESLKIEIEALQDEYNYEMVYKAYDICLKGSELNYYDDVTFNQFQSLYNDKIMSYIDKLDNIIDIDKDGKQILFFSKRYRKYNLLSILKMANWKIDITDELIKKSKPKFEDIYLVMTKRDCQGLLKVRSDNWKETVSEIEMLLSGEIIPKKANNSNSINKEITNSNDVENIDYWGNFSTLHNS